MKRRFAPEDLNRLKFFSWMQAGPDGTCAWVETTGGISHVMQCTADGTVSDIGAGRLPQYRGSALTVLSEETGQSQIRQGARQLTGLRHGVNWFQWSPDGSRAVFTAKLWNGEVADGSWNTELTGRALTLWKEEQARRPQEITEIVNKHDSTHGVFDGSRSRIGIWSESDTCLLPIDLFSTFPVFSPDGDKIAFFGYPHTGTSAMRAELFVYDLCSEQLLQLTDGEELYADTPVSWAGERIIYAAWVMYGEEAFDLRLFSISYAGGDALPLIPDVKTPGVSNMPVSRSISGDELPCYQVQGDQVYYRSAWNSRESLFRAGTDGTGTVETVLSGDFAVHAFTFAGPNTLLAVLSAPAAAEELFRLDLTAGTRAQLTDGNGFLREYDIQIPLESTVLSVDGTAEISLQVIPPAGAEPGKQYPAVLEIHGGPECSYVLDFWHEFQALAGAGIAVIYCNPRGSLGYGPEFTCGSWGEEAVSDLLACVEAACSYSFIDRNRIGVTGGSYGGYMTIKLAGTTKRFQAACAQRALCNTATSYGTGDMGFQSASQAPETINMLDVLTKRAEKSLIRFVDDIDTPMLILHGREDYRCTFEQAEQLFIALRERRPDVPCRLVMFPHENHEITRKGRMPNQIRHLQELTDWFVRYLGGDRI